MKKKVLIFGILSLVLGILLIFSWFFLFNSSDIFLKQKSDDKSNKKQYNDLFEIANELYGKSEFFELPKDLRGAYYLTLAEYKKRGYPIELIDTTCPDDFAFIFFDVENEDKYEKYPIYIIESCHDIITTD